MLIKYLYGKYANLASFINNESSLRFSNLVHSQTMENEDMRDNTELNKEFQIDHTQQGIEISINATDYGTIKLNPKDITKIETNIPITENYYILCFSDKKNDPFLFERFKADVCLSIDINKLLSTLNSNTMFNQLEVAHKSIKYFDKYDDHWGQPEQYRDMIFYKPKKYEPEAEYRIAIKVPKYGRATANQKVSLASKDECMHLVFTPKDQNFYNDSLIDVYHRSH